MKDWFKDLLCILVFLIFTIQLLGVVPGYMECSLNRGYLHNACRPPFSRMITYVAPSFRLGCWLGEPVEEPK